MVPEGTNIMTFIDKYFVRDVSTDELLSTEKVRIVHSDQQSRGFNSNAYVRGKYKHFDIFVSEDVEHTASRDKLQSRQVLIAQRIKELLLNIKPEKYGLRFKFEDEYDLWTKTIGYKLYHIVFFYMTNV
jgi:hypothetical protein